MEYILPILGAASGEDVFYTRSYIEVFALASQEVIEVGTYTLSVQLIATFFAAGTGLIMSIFQAVGKGLPSTVMSVVRGILLIPTLAMMNAWLHMHGVIISLAVTDGIAFLLGGILIAIYFRKEIGTVIQTNKGFSV